MSFLESASWRKKSMLPKINNAQFLFLSYYLCNVSEFPDTTANFVQMIHLKLNRFANHNTFFASFGKLFFLFLSVEQCDKVKSHIPENQLLG